MKHFGIEIFEGKLLKQINLEENIPLEEQWFNLTQDITCIDFLIHDVMEFSVDVGWYPTASVTPNSCFRTVVIEGAYTDGGVFYERTSKTIKQMKLDLQEAILLVQSFKKMPIQAVLKNKIRDYL